MAKTEIKQATFFGWLDRNAREIPEKIAIRSLDQDKQITHGELFRIANQIGRYYEARGIGPNDRVALLSNNSIEHLIVYLASLAYGCTICTIHVEMNARYFESILKAVNALLVIEEPDIPALDGLPKKVGGEWQSLGEWMPEGCTGIFAEFEKFEDTVGNWPVASRTDDVSIFYTSGTSSKPKGVVCSYAELFDNTMPISDAFGITSEDRILDYRSMNWMSAQVLSAIGPIAKGATLFLARKFSVSQFFKWVNDFDITVAAGNPTIINMLVNREGHRGKGAAPSLRFITSSSAPLLVSEWQRFEETFGIQVCQGYGASEVGWIAGSNEKVRKMGSVGRPVAYQKVTIVNAEGSELPADEIGAIQLNGNPSGRYRYLDEDGSIRINSEGSSLTGDLGFIDKDGFLFVTGREKDLIIRGGVNISPLEIDNVILQMSDVADVATVGVPDVTYGEQVVVYVQPKDFCRITPETVLEHCSRLLAEFKIPYEIIFREALPKTERGKMDRNALSEEWKREHAIT
ncbi:MAG: class I adenylate-forming enzyme family protein [Pseudomonadota bacterium]|nr:class I adenylate-forming enzyme family protein [Pseudomonadota bacterium]